MKSDLINCSMSCKSESSFNWKIPLPQRSSSGPGRLTESERVSGYWAGSGMQQRRPGAGVVSHRQARRAFLAAAAKETLPSSCASRYLVNPACPSAGCCNGPHKFTLEVIRNRALGWSRWTQGPVMGPWKCLFPCRNVNHDGCMNLVSQPLAITLPSRAL